MVVSRKACFYYSKSILFEIWRVPKVIQNQRKNDAESMLENVMQI